MLYRIQKWIAEKHAKHVKEFRELSEIWHSNDNRKPWTFSKKLMAFIIANCTIIEMYSLIVMWRFMDLSPLPVLITAVVGECVALVSYQVKSTFENCQNGITYETAMLEMKEKFHQNNDEEAVG